MDRLQEILRRVLFIFRSWVVLYGYSRVSCSLSLFISKWIYSTVRCVSRSTLVAFALGVVRLEADLQHTIAQCVTV